ncbi:MAG: helix-turn-helix domain-containing protein [Kiritimatiellaeota bacterium]|nr:helix-turn-helix domain-containing protein [Kiritimatiellota bacterium]
MNANLTNELMQAVLLAPEERKQIALRVLQGEVTSPTPQAPEPFLTGRQVAAYFGVHTATLWRWHVPSHHFCSSRRYRLSEVLAYLESPAFQASNHIAFQHLRSKQTNPTEARP